MAEHQVHPFPPLYDSQSRVLILGSFPSVKSREGQFFYHHPQNRFWKVLSAVLGEVCPVTVAEKTEMLHRRQIALWAYALALEHPTKHEMLSFTARPPMKGAWALFEDEICRHIEENYEEK